MNDAPAEPRPHDETSATRYPWHGEPGAPWADEAAVLLALAGAGGDHTAHRTVHLRETR